MNEVALSDDLNVITAEINSYKQVAGQAIFEIGKRLKHVKENDLVHGEFGEWLESINMNHRQANKFMKIAEELPNSTSTSNLGSEALYLIATMPEQEREKEHTLSSGEQKTPDEMTNKELREVKEQLKQERQARKDAETREQSAKTSEQIATKKLEDEQNNEPEIKEVVPEDIQKTLSDAKSRLNEVMKENDELKKENDSFKNGDTSNFDEEKEEREKRMLELDAEKNVLRFKIKVDEFLQDVSVNAFMEGAIASSGKSTKEKLENSVDQLKSFTNKMETAIKGRVEI